MMLITVSQVLYHRTHNQPLKVLSVCDLNRTSFSREEDRKLGPK